MEGKMVRERILVFALSVLLLLGTLGGTCFAAEGNQNLIQEDLSLYHEDFYPSGGEIWTFEDGVFESTTDEIAASMWLELPTLTSSYVWSGDITVNSINYEVMPTLDGIKGTFFRVGYDWKNDNYINVVLSSRWSIGVEQCGTTAVQDIYQYRVSSLANTPEYPVMSNGTTFHFEITRDKHKLSMKIDETVILDMDLSNCDKPGDYNLFSDPAEYPFNLGVYSFYSSYKISNMTVKNLYPDEVVTQEPTQTPAETPTVEPTQEATATPTPVETILQQEATKSPVGEADGQNGGNELLYILIPAACVLLVGVIVIVVVLKKKRVQ